VDLGSLVFRSMGEELASIMKAAGFSSPSIIAPPSPGGDGGTMPSKPAAPVTPQKLVGKVVTKTNLKKTNYTKPNTMVPPPNPSLTSAQKAMTPPVVRS